jgi:hypothetical protein
MQAERGKHSMSGTASDALKCACPCNHARFAVTGRPFARFYCHCRICQKLYRRPYADVTIWWGRQVIPPAESTVKYQRYRAPPALRRGICRSCGLPVLGTLWLAPFVELAFVPARNVRAPDLLPQPAVHVFYHRRVKDVDDDLPKVSGYWSSELAVTRLVMGGVVGR